MQSFFHEMNRSICRFFQMTQCTMKLGAPAERAAEPLNYAMGKQVDFLEVTLQSVVKVVLIGDENASLRILNQLHEMHPQKIYSVKSWDNYYEVMNILANKGKGMIELSEMLSIPLSSIMAFGDAENDTEMIRKAGVGIAMGNSAPAVQAAADLLVGSNDEDGIGIFLKEFFSL